MVISALLLAARAADVAFRDADGAIAFRNVASIHAFDGQARSFAGRFDPAALTGELVVSAASLTTGLGPRDSRMLTFALEVERFAEIRFVVDGARGGTAALRAGSGSGAVVLLGRLTVRDVTLPLEISATYTWEGANLHLAGKTDLEWAAWGVPDPSVVISTLLPTMSVTFDIVGKPDDT